MAYNYNIIACHLIVAEVLSNDIYKHIIIICSLKLESLLNTWGVKECVRGGGGGGSAYLTAN